MAITLIKGERTNIGTINSAATGPSGYKSAAYTFNYYATLLDQKVDGNVGKSKIKLDLELSTTYFSYEDWDNARSILTVNGTDQAYKLYPKFNRPAASGGKSEIVNSSVDWYDHNSSGVLTNFSVKARWRSRGEPTNPSTDTDTYYTGNSVAPANRTIGPIDIKVPDIKLYSPVIVDATPDSVGFGDKLIISVPNTSLYTKAVMKIDGSSHTEPIWDYSDGNGSHTAEFAYNTLINTFPDGSGGFVTSGMITITCATSTTSSSADRIGSTKIEVYLLEHTSEGTPMPISMYQSSGATGVSIGYEYPNANGPASKHGFYVYGKGPFEAKVITYKDGSGNDRTITVLALK